MSDIIPETREELFLDDIYNSGSGMSTLFNEKPLTREEVYMAKAAGRNITPEPNTPLTRKEWFLNRINNDDYAKYYGIRIHQDTEDITVEYIGRNKNYRPMSIDLVTGETDYGDWATMPTIVKNDAAMVLRDGTVDYLLDPNDYTKKKADGTASDVSNIDYEGNAFSWFEPLWMYLSEPSHGIIEARFAYSQLTEDYYEVCPTGCGAWLPMFFGSPDANGYMRSIAGTSPEGNKTNNDTTANQATAIAKNGDDYMFLGGKIWQAVTLLCVMWFKSVDSDTWGKGNSDGTGDATGLLNNPIVSKQFYGKGDGKSPGKILHSLCFSTYDVWLRDPYTILDTNSYKLSIDDTYNLNGTGYYQPGLRTTTAQNYIKTMRVVNGFGLVPVDTQATDTKYWKDYVYINTSSVRVGRRGGRVGSGRVDGAFAVDLSSEASGSTWTIGCALILKQPQGGSRGSIPLARSKGLLSFDEGEVTMKGELEDPIVKDETKEELFIGYDEDEDEEIMK